MRFLCLHGAGTNGEVSTLILWKTKKTLIKKKILEIQIGGIRQKLENQGHRFEFMNGKVDAKVEEGTYSPPTTQPKLTPSELEGIVDGPFYNHYARGSSPGSTVQEAFEHTRAIIATQGPFDGVLGFSQGAALAASMIIHHSKTRPAEPPLFRVAVFICGAGPWESTGVRHVVGSGTYPIQIPTANIVGKLDALYPESVGLYELCEPSKASFYDHGSKHMVPFDVKNTEEMVKVIEEAIAKAEIASE
jgi:hypothetical protein